VERDTLDNEIRNESRFETKKSLMLSFVCLAIILTAAPLWAADTSATSAPKEGEGGEKSLTELNKEH
jgi:heme/copper-type cytochrome/quinol oxidase subunit 4